MTENEEIKKVIFGLQFLKEKLYNGIYADRLDCIDYAISALKEIKQYREIGTVQECREAVEKQNPKRLIPVESGMFYDLGFRYKCPNCGIGIKVNNIYHYDVCKICGQKVSNKERGEE